MSQFDNEIQKRAKEVWEVMHEQATNRGMALQRDRTYGDGRVIINTVGAFIKGLSNERGWTLDQNKVDLVRRYLKATGNVVVLKKIEQYKFRIFIRETWHDGLMAEPITKANPSRADKISPEAAGETRPPAPVTFKCAECGKTYDTQNALNAHKAAHKEPEPVAHQHSDMWVGDVQAEVLKALWELGGSVTESSGLVTRLLVRQNPAIPRETAGSAIAGLADRGFVIRKGNTRRTHEITLTNKGEAMCEQLFEDQGEAAKSDPEPQPKGETSRTEVAEKASPDREDATSVANFSDEDLVAEIQQRLAAPKSDPREVSDLKEKVALIASLVDDVMEGRVPPLKALGEIQEAVSL